jgi:hypothetical protein
MNTESTNSDRNSCNNSFRTNKIIIPSLQTSSINNISDRLRWQGGSKMPEVLLEGYRRENLGMQPLISSRYIDCRP